ncbi:Fe-S cluster assembly protein SufD [Adhaeretor mobilis]|uniref:FeS cluster assembly protein SufB n=1 Tax=Adhaeretor mobilis TaxID=1930276 RepID=A0A517MX02_9BACT|nr:Fe-S cluster assembly protein SufD [Adhaeretor mobilis]QDS99408.1 FeS cluster assembly protein SufB [Adhaeretor mobilis]
MTATLEHTGFTQQAFDDFLDARDEPNWLVDMRRAAWKQFGELPMPSGSDEEWMRTDIRLFKLDRYGLPGERDTEAATPTALLAEGVELGGHTRAVDSRTVDSDLSSELAKQGILYGSLGRLTAEHGDLLKPFFERRLVDPSYDKFAALNAACWSGGTLLYVPKGVKVQQPLHALSTITDGGVDLSRTLVILGEDAEATLLSESASSDQSHGGMHCGTIELIVGERARLRYVNLQNWGDRVWHFAHQMGDVAANANLQWTIGALGSRLAKVNQHVALTGQDAEAQVNGVMFTQGKQHLCYSTHQHHKAPFCRSDLLYKAALQDHSRTVWRGMIKVDEPAQRTDAYQRNDNLMLATTARADSIPGLEIEADDVRCTHGSTSGRVDETQVFYAMTRGYTRQEAVRMIVEGFFQQVFDRITIESVREALGEAIGQRVRDL